MDFHGLNYSLTALCIVAVVSFLLGRWSKSDGHLRHQKPIGEVRNPKPLATGNRGPSQKLSAKAEREIEQLLASGRLIAAVKVARRDLGIGLKDAKDLIDQIRHS